MNTLVERPARLYPRRSLIKDHHDKLRRRRANRWRSYGTRDRPYHLTHPDWRASLERLAPYYDD